MNQNLFEGDGKGCLSNLSPIEIDEVLENICQLEKEIEELVFEGD